jgi:hypothetical protein
MIEVLLVKKNLKIHRIKKYKFGGLSFRPENSAGIDIYSFFDKKFPSNVDTVFYRKIGSEERIYYFEDGNYWIAKYSSKDKLIVNTSQ